MQKKTGISLIVLVITIIVMIILAGAIILTINNSGIINKASEAVDASDEATVKELAQLAWAEAYADGVRTVEDLADGTKGFKTRIEEALEKNKIDKAKYILNITTSGVTVKKADKVWVKEGFTVVKGDQVLKIGELVDYTATGTTYNGGWKVLGADDEGNLLIMSASHVKFSHRLGYDTTDTTEAKMEEAQNDWLNGAAELDGICEAYGYGEGAVGKARSITVEDVNAVTGYDPETAENGEPYGSGQLYQYGNEVTYRYSATADKTKPEYTSVVTGDEPKALSNAHTNGFYYYNEETKKFDHITDLATGERGKEFAKLTINNYDYYAPELTTISSTANPEAYQMIFGNYDYYWLASPSVGSGAGFSMRFVGDDHVSECFLWSSYGSTNYDGFGVRAVVTLSSDIQFTEYTANGWSY